MGRAALLVIDMQNDFVLENQPLNVAQARAVIPRIQEALSAFRQRRLPVFHIVRVHRADGSDVEIMRKELFSRSPFAVEGTHGAAVVDELAPVPGEYVLKKTRMSAFLGTELDSMLRTLGVTRLFVCGIQTPNCIRTTVFDALAYNYPVVLIGDATGAASDEVHSANVRDMRNIGVHVAAAEEVGPLLDTHGA